jgi:hypothetical protein
MKATKKSARVKKLGKAKKLEATRTLVSIPFEKIEYQYKTQ